MPLFRQVFLGQEKNEGCFRASFFCLFILALLHFALGFALGKQAYLMMSLLLWSAIGLLVWDRRHGWLDSKDGASFFLGSAFTAALLVISVARPSEKLLGFFPLFAFLGWLLIFVGAAPIRSYPKELLMLLTFGVPKLIPDAALGLAPLTAQFAAYVLHYMGYSVVINGSYIQVPNGGVEVVPACSGINLIAQMLSISVIFLCVFPMARRSQSVLFVLGAALLGFMMNGIRVAILAMLSPPQFSDLFRYWHSASGASLFVLLTLVIYGFTYFRFLPPVNQTKHKHL